GTADDLVPEASVAKLATKLASQRNIRVKYRTIEGANHFFGTHLDTLGEMVDSYLGDLVIEPSAAPVREPELAVALP
ncbi:MAG: alpha/beta hydrolase, partial [Magnetospirillum sp.]